MDDRRPHRPFDGPAIGLLLAFLAAWNGLAPAVGAAEKKEPYGQRIVLQGAATPMFERDLQAVLKDCQAKAVDSGVDAILVFEIHSGPSTFGQAWGIIRQLTSPDYARVRTVAWIPDNQKVTGNNALLALACHDILMHPDAQLGDIGNGKKADDEVQSFVQRLLKSRRNPRLFPALVAGMMDPQTAVKKVTVINTKDGMRTPEVHIVTDEGLRKLRAANREIPDAPVTIKDAGETGLFTGSKANADDVLIPRTAKTLDEVAAVYGLSPRALNKSAAASSRKKDVALIRIKEPITPLLESFLIRQIDRCEQMGKTMIIFEITSPGGYLSSTIRLANRITDLNPEKVRTVAYIPRQALSGAAIISLACDEIYLRPGALIGDAGPIEIGKNQQFEHAPQKILGPLQATLRNLAEKKKRPAALLEAMANKDLVVYRVTNRKDPGRVWYMSDSEWRAQKDKWDKGAVVPESEKDKLLTLTGKRAVELQLADGVIEGKSEDEQMRTLKANLGLRPDMKLVVLERTWVDSLVFWLNSDWVTVLLFLIAIVCIYLEIHTMTGILGIISALCFALFFWSRFLGGTAGWLEVILFVMGLACLAIEIFLIPGFGVFGVTGGILVVSSLVLASQTFGNLETNADFHLMANTLGKLAVTVVLVVAVALALARFLPRIPGLNRMVLNPHGHAETQSELGPRLRPQYVDQNAALIGQRGESLSPLRPAGKAVVAGRMLDVVSDGPFIPAETPVEIVSVAGNRIVVRKA
jgi:membrane-bound serine protease (ClpP class)